jgi:hypothetical protein
MSYPVGLVAPEIYINTHGRSSLDNYDSSPVTPFLTPGSITGFYGGTTSPGPNNYFCCGNARYAPDDVFRGGTVT